MDTNQEVKEIEEIKEKQSIFRGEICPTLYKFQKITLMVPFALLVMSTYEIFEYTNVEFEENALDSL